MKITLFDDTSLSRVIMQYAFENTEHIIKTYEDPGNYRTIIADDPPDVLILDASMRVSGLTIIENLKAIYPDIVFIIYTGDLAIRSRQRYKKAGFAGIIPKSIEFDIDEIAPLFERILDGIDTFNISRLT